jgi:hypothetical protein
MASFLFQPDPIDEVMFKPIIIYIHLGVLKIVDEKFIMTVYRTTTNL